MISIKVIQTLAFLSFERYRAGPITTSSSTTSPLGNTIRQTATRSRVYALTFHPGEILAILYDPSARHSPHRTAKHCTSTCHPFRNHTTSRRLYELHPSFHPQIRSTSFGLPRNAYQKLSRHPSISPTTPNTDCSRPVSSPPVSSHQRSHLDSSWATSVYPSKYLSKQVITSWSRDPPSQQFFYPSCPFYSEIIALLVMDRHLHVIVRVGSSAFSLLGMFGLSH